MNKIKTWDITTFKSREEWFNYTHLFYGESLLNEIKGVNHAQNEPLPIFIMFVDKTEVVR